MSEISEKTLREIDEKKICPMPGWCFRAKNWGFWLLFIVVIAFGSLAVATSIFLVFDYDWEAYMYLGVRRAEHYIMAIPVFWVLLLFLLSILAYQNFKRTKKGYALEIYKILGLSLILSLGLGVLVFSAGLGFATHNFLLENVSIYHQCICTKEDIWNSPNKGLLAGKIEEIKNEKEFLLRDFHREMWRIIPDGAEWPGEFSPAEGIEIKMTGRREPGENIFYPREITPWLQPKP